MFRLSNVKHSRGPWCKILRTERYLRKVTQAFLPVLFPRTRGQEIKAQVTRKWGFRFHRHSISFRSSETGGFQVELWNCSLVERLPVHFWHWNAQLASLERCYGTHDIAGDLALMDALSLKEDTQKSIDIFKTRKNMSLHHRHNKSISDASRFLRVFCYAFDSSQSRNVTSASTTGGRFLATKTDLPVIRSHPIFSTSTSGFRDTKASWIL